MKALAARRRHPAAIVILLFLGLVATGGLYAALSPKPAEAASASQSDVQAGHKLFLSNCASCHGKNAQGRSDTGGKIIAPSLVGVGAASVDFQVGTGRMPLTEPGVQAERSGEIRFNDKQISQLAAYVASLGPGPAIPEKKYLSGGNPAHGGELFRVNCAMCHNFTGAGGALTRGKHAPNLSNVEPKHIYEAMDTGPQSMPVFNDNNISPQNKRDIIAYLQNLNKNENPGGLTLGHIGPVSEGLFAWTFGIGLLIGCAVWLGRKAA
ncbi:MAG TPA: c-type cytochrome [Segeticoccus sp.]|uniref:cytochrome bc1 complex diheme cytochrome c subunit n=1 Tax=Segeticoccus sp. TaxID=2706531 RepID=UPI002D7F464B|nr:c-type cytochrome [Segeticoccus sp.]HET8600321.1 c-type cytochrome [Segeticoccus sp.]